MTTLQRFLDTSYTAFHTTANVVGMLDDNGFVCLKMGQEWQLQRGGKYYVTCNDSSVVAFKVGKQNVFDICESHTDSPCFKVKGNNLVANGALQRLNTEKYGGGILYSFFDRQLKVAGRVLCKDEQGVQSQLVVSNYNVVIPSLAIHHNGNVNDGFAVNAQVDTLPLFAQDDAQLYASLTDKEVYDADLFVTPATASFFSGVRDEFLCSARLDNLTSVFCSVNALLNCDAHGIALCACLDNEEIGSGTRQGASSFLDKVVQSICFALGFSWTEQRNALEQGFALSIDNGHATHPAHAEKADVANKTQLNGGVMIKHNVNYATDGVSSALAKHLLEQNGIKYQDYYNRSDVRCGSTIGLLTSSQLGVRTCDVGLAQLAMHSACETCGAQDIDAMTKFLTAFFNKGV